MSLFPELKPSAQYSPCGKYRYCLRWPTGIDNDRIVVFVLANPSTATEFQTDRTVARCIDYAKRWGYGWCWVVNVRAWRETEPEKLPADPMAIGPDNDFHITCTAGLADLVVCGWGNLGGEQGKRALVLIQSSGAIPYALKLNQDGSPGHPLYLSRKLVPILIPNEQTIRI